MLGNGPSSNTISASALPCCAASALTCGATSTANALSADATTNRTMANAAFLIRELFIEDAILKVVFGIEQQCNRLVARFANDDFDDVADFVGIGRRADRTLVRIEDLELHFGARAQDRAAPAPWAERTDRRHRQNVGAERQDGTMRGQV